MTDTFNYNSGRMGFWKTSSWKICPLAHCETFLIIISSFYSVQLTDIELSQVRFSVLSIIAFYVKKKTNLGLFREFTEFLNDIFFNMYSTGHLDKIENYNEDKLIWNTVEPVVKTTPIKGPPLHNEKYLRNIYVYQLKHLNEWNLNKEKLSGT